MMDQRTEGDGSEQGGVVTIRLDGGGSNQMA